MGHNNETNPTNLEELFKASGLRMDGTYPVPFTKERLDECSLTTGRIMRIMRNNGKPLTEGEIKNVCRFFGISRKTLLEPLPEGFKARIRIEVYSEEVY